MMKCGGLCVMTLLVKLMLMWHADNWAILQRLTMELWDPWGMPKKLTIMMNALLFLAIVQHE